MKEAGFGLKAATITPEKAGDVGSPNAILREQINGTVIVRTGRRIPGVRPVGGAYAPISVIRMAVDDAYGAKAVSYTHLDVYKRQLNEWMASVISDNPSQWLYWFNCQERWEGHDLRLQEQSVGHVLHA